MEHALKPLYVVDSQTVYEIAMLLNELGIKWESELIEFEGQKGGWGVRFILNG